MKIEYIKSFSNELNKMAGILGAGLGAAFAIPAITGAAKQAKQSAMNLGKSAPYRLQPMTNLNLSSPLQYPGIRL